MAASKKLYEAMADALAGSVLKPYHLGVATQVVIDVFSVDNAKFNADHFASEVRKRRAAVDATWDGKRRYPL